MFIIKLQIHCATCVVIERFLKVFGKDGDVALSAAVKFGVEVKVYKTFFTKFKF